MFNGIIYFQFTPNGYVVDDFYISHFYLSHFNGYQNKIDCVWPSIKSLRIEGTFNFQPKRGQFCKRPHKLIAWDK